MDHKLKTRRCRYDIWRDDLLVRMIAHISHKPPEEDDLSLVGGESVLDWWLR